MKKVSMWMVSAAVAGLLLGGCGDKKSESASREAAPKTEVKAEAAAPAPAAKPVEEKAAPAPEAKPEPEAAMPAKEEVAKKVDEIQQGIDEEAQAAKAAAEQKVEEAKKAIDAATLYTKCAGCHGMKGEKHALGQSNIIGGQSKAELVEKIEGYKKGTYGGAMKGLMAGQVKNLTPEEIDALADYISKL
ncbi:c-type cytochrome [Hydrogenimonas sp.]